MPTWRATKRVARRREIRAPNMKNRAASGRRGGEDRPRGRPSGRLFTPDLVIAGTASGTPLNVPQARL